MASNGSNSQQRPQRPLVRGVYCPSLTFFEDSSEDLDLVTFSGHVQLLASAGIKGIVALGSNGEAVHLTSSERAKVIEAARSALDKAGFPDVPVIAGCSEQSTRATINLCKEAYGAGADYAIILPPFYYKPAMTDNAICDFFSDVAKASPLPVLLYNYPGAVAGIDMSSDVINKIAQHPNVRGAKFTCASTGKITRVAAESGNDFSTFGGMADITVQTFVSGGTGVIAGTANVLPKLCVHVWNLADKGDVKGAMAAQKMLADVDWTIGRVGVSGTKAALQETRGYGGHARRPLPKLDGEATAKLVATLKEAVIFEKSN